MPGGVRDARNRSNDLPAAGSRRTLKIPRVGRPMVISSRPAASFETLEAPTSNDRLENRDINWEFPNPLEICQC